MALIIVPFTATDSSLPVLATATVEFDAFSTALLAATGASSVDNVLSTPQQMAIKEFILAMKIGSVNGTPVNLYDKVKYCMPLAGNSLAAALVPLIGAAPTNVSYVAGDYNETLGIRGNNTKRLQLPNTTDTYGSNLGILLRTTDVATDSTTQDVLTLPIVTTAVFGLHVRYSMGFFGYANSAGGYISGPISPTVGTFAPAGSYGCNVVPGSFRAFVDRVGFGDTSDTGGGTVPTNPLSIFRKDNRYGGFMLVDSMSHAEFLEANRHFDDLMVALGR